MGLALFALAAVSRRIQGRGPARLVLLESMRGSLVPTLRHLRKRQCLYVWTVPLCHPRRVEAAPCRTARAMQGTMVLQGPVRPALLARIVQEV